MTTTHPRGTPPLPTSIWVVAWSCLAGQVVALLVVGGRSDDAVSFVGSIVLGALVLGYASAGVVRARTVRLVLTWIVLGLVTVAELVGAPPPVRVPPRLDRLRTTLCLDR